MDSPQGIQGTRALPFPYILSNSSPIHQQALLPEILADAFPDDPKAKETPITIWGVQIDPSKPRNAKVSVILMKFLRAR